ncbi:hypothetical protein [Porphyrobacter sp. CACIAM 03H1]|uniref:hypothetical protein n=1 Tax=Porphyrobacter sp. CACIAM 03H1 TaxID=2003315 RepID=UPI000B5A39EC|nr:hypothetical protein [Porphyrobacter sp. CACIAM 03H1]ASJ91258.1 hypothetical protein CBR61_10265 [Porphyrobacter sp. CACIAM 03H1]
MDRYELDQAVNRQIEQAYWPWWFAVAYVQSKPARYDAMRGGVETHLASKGSSVDAVGAFGRVVAVLCGDDDPDSETFRNWQARAEDRLMMAIRAGKVKAWGRTAPSGSLVEIAPSDWVGSEVDCSDTCDLVREGWRDLEGIDRALNGERVVWFSDIHLPREQVMAWADHLDQEAQREIQNVDDTSDSEAFESITAGRDDLEGGFWSAFVTCAWVGSRCEAFTAKAQRFECEQRLDRGGVYSQAAWIVLSGAMRHRFGVSGKDALRRLQVAIGDRVLAAGSGLDLETGRSRDITPAEWARMTVIHDQHGTSLVPGVYGVSWSSTDVRAAFPSQAGEATEIAPEPQNHRPLHNWKEPAPPAMTLAEASADVLAWVHDYDKAGLPLRSAYSDAVRRLGAGVLRKIDVDALLKEAKTARRAPVVKGRPRKLSGRASA